MGSVLAAAALAVAGAMAAVTTLAGPSAHAAASGPAVPRAAVAASHAGSTVATATGASAPDTSTLAATSKLIFDDEFNGTSIDESKWSVGWPGWQTRKLRPTNSYESACYDPANVTESGGSLNLRLTTSPCLGKPYSGASVVSYQKFDYSYGTLVARIYVPGNSSTVWNWPNLWGNGEALNWPADGENDTFEGLQGKACYHFHSSDGGPGGCVRMAGGWHIVESTWTPGRVTYYYDGIKVGAITTGVSSGPQYLALQYTYSPQWAGPLRAATYKVDWIRVYSAGYQRHASDPDGR